MNGWIRTLIARTWAAGSATADAAEDLLFPPRCVWCQGDFEATRDERFCPACRDKLAPTEWSGCPRCARRDVTPATAAGCPDCARGPLHFDKVIPLGQYQGDLRQVVLQMKRPQGQTLAAAIGELLVDLRQCELTQCAADLIVPIPHSWRRWLRQPASSPQSLGRRVSARLRIPPGERALTAIHKRFPQHKLRPKERFRNVRGTFRVAGGISLAEKRVLLIDDILTTGATASEAARVLKQAGASWVGVAVAARASSDLDFDRG